MENNGKEPKMTYDAFISYSHSEPDAFVARKLHTMLEHYRVPKKIQERSGKKKIERVFRDREELPLSSNLASNICEALENSEYLIVICSPRSIRSEWVKREIETFLMTHEKERVLTLLVEGEPEEVFPEILCYEEEHVIHADGTKEVVKKRIEPMAADIRGKDRQETEKKLKEEFLRILAPMLSCSYDTLKQRHRDYTFRRILAATGAVAVLAVLFTIYAFHQAAVTDEQYQEARRNQARYLARISGELLETGDRLGALKTALAIVPEEEDAKEPVVPEQMYALNNALYTYRNTNRIDFKPDSAYELEGQTVVSTKDREQMLSPEETAYFCMDQLGNAYILDLESGECIWKIRPEDLEDYDDGEFQGVIPVSEEEAVLVSEHEIRCLNWREQSVTRVIKEEDGDSYSRPYLEVTVKDSYMGLTNGKAIWIYDLEDGKELQKVSCVDEEEAYGSYSPNAMAFSEDGETLAVGFSTDYAEMPQKGIVLVSVKDGSLRELASDNTKNLIFLGEDKIASWQYQYVNGTEEVEDVPKLDYRVVVYTVDTGKCLWESENYDIQAFVRPSTMTEGEMLVDGKMQSVLTVSLKDRLLVLCPQTGDILLEKGYPDDIIGVERYDESRYLVGLANGKIYLALMNHATLSYGVGDISSETANMLFSSRQACTVQSVDGSRNIVFSRFFRDEQMTSLSMEEDIASVTYLSCPVDSEESITYRCVIYDARGDGADSGLRIYEPGSSECIYEYVCQKEDGRLSGLVIQNIDGIPCARFEEFDLDDPLHMIADLNTGETLVSQQDFSGTSLGLYSSCSFHGDAKVVLHAGESFVITDVSEDGVTFPDEEQAISAGEYISDIQVTENDQYILVEIREESGEYLLKVWNVKEHVWQSFGGKDGIMITDHEYRCGRETSVMAVYDKHTGSIETYDLEEGMHLQSIQVGYFDTIDFQYFNHDEYLIVCGESQFLSMWDAENGEVKMQNSDSIRDWGNHIYVDGSEHYFGLSFDGYTMSDDYFYSSQISLYYVDDEGRFYHFADVPYGCASFEAEEIFVKNGGGSYSRFYSYPELRARAEQVLDGEELSDAEKKQYFVSE